jgi:hypothetical protein
MAMEIKTRTNKFQPQMSPAPWTSTLKMTLPPSMKLMYLSSVEVKGSDRPGRETVPLNLLQARRIWEAGWQPYTHQSNRLGWV